MTQKHESWATTQLSRTKKDTMDKLDRDIQGLISVLSSIVNRASRTETTSAEAVKVVKVPVGLISTAKQALEAWKDTEYSTESLRHACDRCVD